MTVILTIAAVVAAILVAWRGGKSASKAEQFESVIKTKREADEIEKSADDLSTDDIRDRLRRKR